MRPATLVVALVAGTAVRILLSVLPPFRRRRNRARLRRQNGTNLVEAPSTTALTHQHHRSPASLSIAKRAHLAEVAALLNRRAPPVRADIWHSATVPNRPDPECTFCLEQIRPLKHHLLRETPCNHIFHAACLEQWVFYTAETCLDWTQYTLSDDGSIDLHARPPSCPNCSADLSVLPDRLVRSVMLVSVARSLSLRDLATAAEMYDAGLVYRAGTDSARASPSSAAPASRSAPSLPSVATQPEDTGAQVQQVQPVPNQGSFPPRRDSTMSEPYLPATAFVTRQDHAVHALSRRSLPDEHTVSRPRSVSATGSSEHDSRGRRRRRRLGRAELAAGRLVLQASS